VGGAEGHAGIGEAEVGDAFGNAEVSYFDCAVAGDEDVLGLDVAMDKAAAMGIFEAGEYLVGDVDGAINSEGAAACPGD
jgi:hypothetical protein